MAWMQSRENRRLKVGVLGCGPIAQAAHFLSCRKARNAELYAICDVADDLRERMAWTHAPQKTFADYDTMLADPDLEAVIIAISDAFHVSASIKALEAGKHVLCEKPVGVSVDEVRRLKLAVNASGKCLQVGHMKRFDAGIQAAKAFIEGEMGEMLALKAWYSDSTHRYVMTNAVQPAIVTSSKARKPDVDPKADLRRYFMLAHGSHLVDTVRFLAGPIVEVDARHRERFGAHCWFVDVTLSSGAFGHLDLTIPVRMDWHEGFQIYGQYGSVVAKTYNPWYYKTSDVGYAFADVNPQFDREKETLTMGITFNVAETPRVFVERIDINGNTLTQDKVIRREFRLNEGDAFNSFQVKRSTDRIKSLGYFQEDLEVEQTQGSGPDRIILTTNVEEKPNGQLSLSAGFSSLENFIFQGSIEQNNFRGKGQQVRASVSYSSYSKSAEIGFTEPYLFDRSIALSGDIFRRDLNSFSFGQSGNRQTTYAQTSTGFQLRTGVPINEYLYFQARYGLSFENVTLDQNQFFSDPDGTGPLPLTCDAQLAGRFLCDAIGKRSTSTLGYTLLYDTRDNRVRPTRGHSVSLTQDFAGLGGSVKYVRSILNANKYWRVTDSGFIFSLSGEGGYIHPLQNRGSAANEIDDVRLTDRFYLGEPQIRGFDIRGIGPRIQLLQTAPALLGTGASAVAINAPVLDANGNISPLRDDAIGGRAYYLTRAELEIPLGSGAKELGLRPSVFVDAGAVFRVTSPILTNTQTFSTAIPATTTTPGVPAMPQYLFVNAQGLADVSTVAVNADGTARTPSYIRQERFLGNSIKPRLSVGFGVNWRSPFGPFRIDIAKALLKEPGDDTKLITFNVGTQF